MIGVRVDDIAFFEGDAIARPVNAELEPTTTLTRRLEQAGGAALVRQLRVQEPLPVGSAVVTGSGAGASAGTGAAERSDLRVPFLIHAVVMSATEPVTRGSVRRATTSALQRATDWGLERVAFAPFGLGAGNLDIEDSAEVMIDAMVQHLARSRAPLDVTVVVESDEEAKAFASRLPPAAPS